MASSNDALEQNEIINEITDGLPCNKPTELKPGIKLPKTDTQWIEVEIFFRSELHTGDINDYNLTKTIERMNNIIYNYFAKTYGPVKNKNYDKGFHDTYKDFGKRQLKKELRHLNKDRQ